MNDQQTPPAANEPAKVPMTPAWARFPILQHFRYDHLPEPLGSMSKRFHDLAHAVADAMPSNAESTTALRKLMEAKDCAVRSLRHKDGGVAP